MKSNTRGDINNLFNPIYLTKTNSVPITSYVHETALQIYDTIKIKNLNSRIYPTAEGSAVLVFYVKRGIFKKTIYFLKIQIWTNKSIDVEIESSTTTNGNSIGVENVSVETVIKLVKEFARTY